MKAVVVIFNRDRTDYLLVGPFKTDEECNEEIKRLRSVYSAKAVEAIEQVNMLSPGTIKPDK